MQLSAAEPRITQVMSERTQLSAGPLDGGASAGVPPGTGANTAQIDLNLENDGSRSSGGVVGTPAANPIRLIRFPGHPAPVWPAIRRLEVRMGDISQRS